MATTMSLQRAWSGPALFTYGFRPFFLFGALHAALMVALWVPWHLGVISIPSAFPPVVWHSHELLFGFVPAVVAGFLLTATPNWTGRLPVVGWPLALLFGLWLAGRIAIAASAHLSPLAAAALALAFPLALAGVLGRELVAGRNWRNLKVLAGVAALALAQALFHYEAWRHGRSTYGDHLALAATLVLIMIVGGRIVPSFTTNWLKQNNPGPLPAPFDRFDMAAMIVGVAALGAWVAAPALRGSRGRPARCCWRRRRSISRGSCAGGPGAPQGSRWWRCCTRPTPSSRSASRWPASPRFRMMRRLRSARPMPGPSEPSA